MRNGFRRKFKNNRIFNSLNFLIFFFNKLISLCLTKILLHITTIDGREISIVGVF